MGGRAVRSAVWRQVSDRQNRRSIRRLQTLTAVKFAEAIRCQPSKLPKDFVDDRQNRQGIPPPTVKTAEGATMPKPSSSTAGGGGGEAGTLAQEVLHDWQGTELSNELRPADPKNDDATGLQVVARWAGNHEETSEKGHRREANLEMLIQVDH